MELVLTIPVLVILLLGVVEFGCLLRAYGTIASASQRAAQIAAKFGVGDEQVDTGVQRSLGTRLFAVAEVRFEGADAPGNDLACSICVPMAACAPNLLWPIGFDLEGESLECTSQLAMK